MVVFCPARLLMLDTMLAKAGHQFCYLTTNVAKHEA
jgi:hypothetical protein